jgi:hypothetical protein
MSMETKSRGRTVLGATAGASMLIFTFACGGGTSSDLTGVAAQTLTTNQAGAPVLVSCEPHQRTLVRPVVVNGAMVSQVECVAVGQTAASVQNQLAAAVPVSYNRAAYPAAAVERPVNTELGDAQIVPVSSPSTTVARPVRTRQVVYDEQPVRRTRSVKKSAVIIGSSAGVGAGVGAAVGGKKGALIGAAIGGGGAAIWDQITRRK